MDNRGVPHIKASSDQDAMVALGYVVVRDRLFQADFIHRVSTGRLAELLGEEALSIDQHFYRNGIVHAVRRNTRLMADRMPREFKAVESYVRGANAWLSQLDPEDYPLEYRLLDAQPPDSITSEFTMALYAYMAYDLSFRSTDRSHAFARASMGDAMFQRLYPEYSIWEKPIIQAGEGWWAESSGSSGDNGVESGQDGGKLSMMAIGGSVDHERHVVAETGSVSVSGESRFKEAPSWQEAIMEGFTEGKGSNNWAVSGSRSATGMPILAGDMHLSLILPAIWYEAHLITPTTNVYGVTFPAVPGIVEGITPTTAWAFTNTGSDQLDTYRIELSDDGRHYRYDDTWLDLEVQRDTIRVKDG
ncbi:MAG: penicillin acylase family protein, partial [Rhodothermales bacterium]